MNDAATYRLVFDQHHVDLIAAAAESRLAHAVPAASRGRARSWMARLEHLRSSLPALRRAPAPCC
ncbi:hypothetical protein [Geodermatophilus dictyosporus]|uniref:hypothetical protein n=1 Tax=Geodermatophilus dictyosporus TaxID=1523247 RepID=UPI0010AA0033|nr:hypothetical protein [Geodermatophilus dictyosporus]